MYDQLDELLIRVRAILKTLKEPTGGDRRQAARTVEYQRLWELKPDELADEIASAIEDVEEKTADLAQLHTSAEGEIALLARYEPILGEDPAAREADRHHRRLRQRRAARRAPLQGGPRASADRARQAHELAERDHLDRHRREHDRGDRRLLPPVRRAGPQVPGDGERQPDSAAAGLPGHADGRRVRDDPPASRRAAGRARPHPRRARRACRPSGTRSSRPLATC